MEKDQEVKDQPAGAEQSAGKEEKKFQDTLDKLVALLNGDVTARKKPKVRNDRVSLLVAKINEERTKNIEEEFVKDGITLLDSWAQFDQQCNEEKKKFEAAIQAKMKEFREKIEKLFSKLESIDKINGQYKASLSKVLNPPGVDQQEQL